MNLKAPKVSFEFFPPATEKMADILWRSVERLAPLAPEFVSVTYGADGSTRDRTHRIVSRIQDQTTLTGAPHLTCVGATKEEVLEHIKDYVTRRLHLSAVRPWVEPT